MPKALAAWLDLNDRQQETLRIIFEIDQAIEAARAKAAARREYDRQPASEWRLIDFAVDTSMMPYVRRRYDRTELQDRLIHAGWDNQGNGATIAALARRGLIENNGRDRRSTPNGEMIRIRMTKQGRAAARAGLDRPRTPKAALGEFAWKTLVLLWEADQKGDYLHWQRSTTIDNVLIKKHVPPLAEHAYSDGSPDPAYHGQFPDGFRITDRGRWFYREHYAAHVTAHPSIPAPHPDGKHRDPWPEQADEILWQHLQLCNALAAEWKQADDTAKTAAAEAETKLPEPPAELPAAAAQMRSERHDLLTATARQRAELAAAQRADLETRCAAAARNYAVAALAVYKAAVAGTDPLEHLDPPDPDDDGTWDEPRLEPPAKTGVHAADEKARRLHLAAAGQPRKRKGPEKPPKHRRPAGPELPGRKYRELKELAEFLRYEVAAGELTRRMHPEAYAVTEPGTGKAADRALS